MLPDVFINISKIVEQESKTSTYKFALLRGTIDLIQDNSPYIKVYDDRAYFPMSLLINKWIFYYYPLIKGPKEIPQINSQKGIAFEKELKKLIDIYEKRGGKSVLYNDIRTLEIYKIAAEPILLLYKKLQNTISNMPMKYLGSAISQTEYSIFKYHPEKRSSKQKSQQDLLKGYGEFSIPREYYDALQILGSFINGQDSILAKWADFSFKSAKNRIKAKSSIISRLTDNPITERNVNESKSYIKKILSQAGTIKCVWSGISIRNNKYHIDHLLPFSIWRNNDLWNLLPTNSSVNIQKSDKIPSLIRLENSRTRIFEYWDILFSSNEIRFTREIEHALLGRPISNGWKERAFDRLKSHSEFLIKYRGYEQW